MYALPLKKTHETEKLFSVIFVLSVFNTCVYTYVHMYQKFANLVCTPFPRKTHETILRQRKWSAANVSIRVTRFGEFSPLGRLFTLGRFCILHTEVAQNLGLQFSRSQSYDF
jgi:hypothetical protein